MTSHCFPGGKTVEVTFYPYIKEAFKYQYPGEEENSIPAGETYEITPISPGFLGGQCEEGYRIVYRRANCRRGNFRSWSGQFTSGVVTGPISSIYGRGHDGSTIELPNEICSRVGFKIVAMTPTGEQDATGFFGGAYHGTQILGVVRADGAPDDCGDPPTQYLFEVFNAAGTKVFERTDDAQPEVTPPACVKQEGFTKNYEVYPFPSLLNIIPGSHSGAGDGVEDQCLEVTVIRFLVGPQVKIRVGDLLDDENIAQEPLEFADIVCSSEGCPPPDYEVKCDPSKECPEGTCFECDADGKVCCYGEPTKDGVHPVIYSFYK